VLSVNVPVPVPATPRLSLAITIEAPSATISPVPPPLKHEKNEFVVAPLASWSGLGFGGPHDQLASASTRSGLHAVPGAAHAGAAGVNSGWLLPRMFAFTAPSEMSPPLRFSNTTSTVADVVPVGRKQVDCTPGSVSQSSSTLELNSMSGSSIVTIAGMHTALVSMFGLQSANEEN
jgi:hypothetical protein